VVSLLSSNAVSFTNNSLIQGVQYWFRLQAFNDYGVSPYSNEDDAVPVNIVNLMADDFDPDLDTGVWAGITGAVATNGGQGFRGNKALYFAASGARHATTIPLEVSSGGTIDFFLRSGNEAVDGTALWNNSESGETVVLEYTRDNGTTWTTIQTLNTVYPSLTNWIRFSVAIPSGATGTTTQFRWRQLVNSGVAYDCWALDEVAIQGAAPLPPGAVPFTISSACSSSSIAVFWVGAARAASYVVERKTGLQPWMPIATLPVFVTYYMDFGLAPGTPYSYRIQAVNAGGGAAYSPIATSFTWSPMQQWISDNYGSPESLTIQDMTACGSDGCMPILRYAYNLTANEPLHLLGPGGNSGYPRIWLNPASKRLSVEFIRRSPVSNPGITYTVQFSGDVSNWSTGGTHVRTTPIDSTWERVIYEDPSAAGVLTSRFCRVTIGLLP
jgi:hypothetical protein